MVYLKKLWADDEIIEVDELNHIEQGIYDAHASITTLQTTLAQTVTDRLHVYDSDNSNTISLAPSGVNESVTDIDVTFSNVFSVQVSFTGSASEIEVAVYCANDGFAYAETAIGVMNLSQTLKNNIIFLASDFDKIKLKLTNKDAVNAAVVSVAIKVLTSTGSMLTTRYDFDDDGIVNEADMAGLLDDDADGKTYAQIAAEIDADILTHKNNASAHHAKYTDAEAQAAINADADHGSTAQHNYRTDEEIRDVVGAMAVAGENVLIDYNDVNNTLTISATGGTGTGLTEEQLIKFNGIETGATADMTASEIVALINASASVIDADNVNVSGSGMTQAQIDKLNSIETGATADQTAAEIVALINASALKIDLDNTNLANLTTVIERGFMGEVSIGDSLRIYMPKAGTIQSVTFVSGVQPSGENFMANIYKNGYATTNSIFSSDSSAVLTTSATATNGVYTINGSLDATQTSLVAGDVLRVFVTQAGAVADLTVCIEVLC